VSTLTKVFIVLTAVLAIVSSILYISSAAQWDNWRDLAMRYQAAEQAAQTARMNAEATTAASLAMKDDALAQRARDIGDLQKKTQDQGNELARVNSELARKSNEALSFEAGRTKLQEILGVTTGELQGLQKQNQSLQTSNMDLQTRNSKLNSRVLELTANVTILTDQLRNLQEKNYAYEQQITQLQKGGGAGTMLPTGGPAAPGATAVVPQVRGNIQGRIIDIAGNYASINIGESSGVAPGMTFMIHRDGSYVGDLVIDNVRPTEAGGKLALVKGEVKKGDPVRSE
jgi:hypothetical protein